MNEELTEEELRILVNDNEIFEEYDLKNIYTVEEKGSGKQCSICGITYTEKTFHTYKSSVCIECNKLRSKEHYIKNKKKMNDYARDYARRQRAWYMDNPLRLMGLVHCA